MYYHNPFIRRYKMNKDYLDLVAFWNNSMAMDEESLAKAKEELNPDEDYKDLAPSPKLREVLLNFKDCQKVLDYGCGSGWASIIMSKSGVGQVISAEVAPNAIRMVEFYSEAFGVKEIIKPILIDEHWLSQEAPNQYDGFYCSNVIDVIPLSMAKDIIEASSKVTNRDAVVIFSTNYYIDPQIMKEKGCEVKDNQIYINGILRLNALTDEEWTKIFKEYYQDVEISYFAWPGEAKETRRIFILKK